MIPSAYDDRGVARRRALARDGAGEPMPRVLLVDSDPDSREAFQRALMVAGYEVAVAPSGSFALTTLEWDRPDIIVTQARVGDMSGCDLFLFVRSDPKTGEIPFLLLAGLETDLAGAAAEAGMDAVSTGHLSVGALVERVAELTRPNGSSGSEDGLRGSLGVIDLPGLSQAIALGGKTGRLSLALPAGSGRIDLVAGRPVHAEFAGEVGEEAFAALVATAHAGGGSFSFTSADGGFPEAMPRTIHRSLDRLLLAAAADIDEGRWAPSGEPGSLAGSGQVR